MEKDYKWWSYCKRCKHTRFIGDLSGDPEWPKCEKCGELLHFRSKDALGDR